MTTPHDAEGERVGPWFTRHREALERQKRGREAFAAMYADIEYGPRKLAALPATPSREGANGT